MWGQNQQDKAEMLDKYKRMCFDEILSPHKVLDHWDLSNHFPGWGERSPKNFQIFLQTFTLSQWQLAEFLLPLNFVISNLFLNQL